MLLAWIVSLSYIGYRHYPIRAGGAESRSGASMSPILSIVVGATLLTVITIAYGGTFVLRATTGGYPFNGL